MFNKKYLHLVLLSFVFITSSCIQLSSESTDTAKINSPTLPPTSTARDKIHRFRDIKYSRTSTLNLISDVSIEFSNNANWPLSSHLIIQNENQDVLFYGVVESKNDIFSIQVPFDQKDLFVKIVNRSEERTYVSKKVKITDGKLRL